MTAISVVVPSWNTCALLRACLEGLERAEKPECEVIVVDNGSDDGSADMVAERFPAATLIQNERNEGYAKACNQGIEASGGSYVLLLNSDAVVAGDALVLLHRFLEEHERYAAVAPRLVAPDGTTQKSLKRFPTLKTALFFATPLERWFPRSRELARYLMRDDDQESDRDVEQPPAACLLLRRKALGEVGVFDESLWLFYNDVDLSKRLAAAGWRTRYLADARVVHHEGASTSKLPFLVPIWQGDRLRYYRKHHGRLGGLWLKLCVTLAFLDWSLLQLGLRLRRRGGERVGPMARSFGAFLLQ